MQNTLKTGLFLLVLWLLTACSGLAGEPAIVATLPPAPENTDIGFPVDVPDLIQGALTFADRCVRCHGPGGAGDGELVASGELPSPPTDMTDPVTARTQTPYDWFQAISNGSLEKLMPPWRDTLSETTRWDVAFYSYTISYTQSEITQGQAIWQAECASCHGESGQGDGPDAPGPMPSLTDAQWQVQTSDADMVLTVSSGMGEMPAFADTLDESQRWAVVAYLRTLALANTQAIDNEMAGAEAPIATEEATQVTASEPEPTAVAAAPEADTTLPMGTVSGSLIYASAGSDDPQDLTAILHIVDPTMNEETVEQAVGEDGTYLFEDVPIAPDQRYFVTVMYGDGFFISDIVLGESDVLELPVTVYERTDDAGVISVAAMLAQVTETDEGLQVIQILNFANNSDRMYLSSEVIDEFRQSSVRIQLPPDAVLLDLADESGRYVVDGNTVIDTRPIFPGEEHIVHVLYALPFGDSASISQPLDYALEGPVRLLAPEDLSISGQQFPQGAPQNVSGTVYNSYGSELSLAAGSRIQFDVSRAGGMGPDTGLLSAVLFAIGGVSILLAAVLFIRGRGQTMQPAPTAPSDAAEGLIAAIADLDERFEAGELSRRDYEKQRKMLKDRLSQHMQEGGS